jgi:exo-1,4-beta-D-glucosaminidase
MNYPEFHKYWKLQSSRLVHSPGKEVSLPSYPAVGWYSCTVPCTVLGALVQNGVYPEIYRGMNLQKIPTSDFAVPWWYRKEFILEELPVNQSLILELKGVNYQANIYINGLCIASREEIFGAFRIFMVDLTDKTEEGINILAMEVFPPRPGDFSTGFVDWNPPPPDRNMGLFKSVTLHLVNRVKIHHPYVTARLSHPNYDLASLRISCFLTNYSDRPVIGQLCGKIADYVFRQETDLMPGEKKEIQFLPEDFPGLNIANPRLWWPYQWGHPYRYELELEFQTDDRVADFLKIPFGIREVTDYFDNGHRGFMINGKKILIKGAGWTDDLLLQDDTESLEAQISYVKHLRLNCIRLEGIWGKDETLFELCDREGILMMVGWSCHWEHEQYLGKPVHEKYGGVFQPADIDLIARSWQDQVLWLRNHCSIFVWAVASDFLPHPDLEKKYIETFTRYDPDRPYLNSTGGVGSEQAIIGSSEIISELSGSSGVKMLGPYAYTPPVYWYTDQMRGGAYGFNTETCPGANVPPIESILKMIPEDHLWPIDEVWEFHCGLNEFRHLNRTVEAITRRYGPVAGVNDFARKAQLLNYELMRPMFEAFQANHPRATGVIQWMLNSAFPEMYWQLYDSYLMPNGAFYATRKACEPLHLIYHYGEIAVYLVNELLSAFKKLNYSIRLYDQHSRPVFSLTGETGIESQSVEKIAPITTEESDCPVHFLDLRLFDRKGTLISSNFYWLSRKPDVLDYDQTAGSWSFYTPTKDYADFTALQEIPPAETDFFFEGMRNGFLHFTLKNQSPVIAFFIELKIMTVADRELLLPVWWDDNYLSLLPGERRNIRVKIPQPKEGQLALLAEATGLNTGTTVINIEASQTIHQ